MVRDFCLVGGKGEEDEMGKVGEETPTPETPPPSQGREK